MMKKTFLFLVAAGILFSCKKSSSGASSQASNLKSITIYFPSVHIVNIQTFTYNGTQLTQYTCESIDTSSTQILQETRIYSFQYTTSVTLPSSSTFQVTDYEGTNMQNGGGSPEAFLYDNNNRLIEDTSAAVSGQSDYNFYSYAKDSVSFTDSQTLSGSFSAGGLDILNGNVAVSSEVSIDYGSTSNPLYDPSIGNTFGVYFYAGLIQYIQPDYSLQVDFISKNLPTSWNDRNGNRITTFSWTTGPDGKVTSGTAVNFLTSLVGYNDTARITFTYQ